MNTYKISLLLFLATLNSTIKTTQNDNNTIIIKQVSPNSAISLLTLKIAEYEAENRSPNVKKSPLQSPDNSINSNSTNIVEREPVYKNFLQGMSTFSTVIYKDAQARKIQANHNERKSKEAAQEQADDLLHEQLQKIRLKAERQADLQLLQDENMPSISALDKTYTLY